MTLFITRTEKGSEHTWCWRDEDDGGADLFCYLPSLLRFANVFLCCFFPVHSPLSLSLSLSFSFFSRLLSYVLLSLLSSLVAFLVSYALPPSVFFSLRSPLPLFFLSSISLSFFFFISCSLSFSGFYRPGKALRW